MKKANNNLALLFLIIFILFPSLPVHGQKAPAPAPIGQRLEITLLQGRARLNQTGKQPVRSLGQGDFLIAGDEVYTEKNTRIELKIADLCFVRFDELTAFKVIASGSSKGSENPNIHISILTGKAWASIPPLFSGQGRFTMSTPQAFTWVRGTVYRVNVNEDNSIQVKVYRGEVVVEKRPETEKTVPENDEAAGAAAQPGTLAASHNTWAHIVGPMRQLVVQPDGSWAKPFRFSVKADENEWVLWNRQRDPVLTSAGLH